MTQVKIRKHQDYGGFGRLLSSKKLTRATLVNVPFPGYMTVKYNNNKQRVVPTFAVLTTKTGWALHSWAVATWNEHDTDATQ